MELIELLEPTFLNPLLPQETMELREPEDPKAFKDPLG
jgi:hypothetical protein